MLKMKCKICKIKNQVNIRLNQVRIIKIEISKLMNMIKKILKSIIKK